MLARRHSEGETDDTRVVGTTVGGEGPAGGGEGPADGGEDQKVVGAEDADDIGGGEGTQ